MNRLKEKLSAEIHINFGGETFQIVLGTVAMPVVAGLPNPIPKPGPIVDLALLLKLIKQIHDLPGVDVLREGHSPSHVTLPAHKDVTGLDLQYEGDTFRISVGKRHIPALKGASRVPQRPSLHGLTGQSLQDRSALHPINSTLPSLDLKPVDRFEVSFSGRRFSITVGMNKLTVVAPVPIPVPNPPILPDRLMRMLKQHLEPMDVAHELSVQELRTMGHKRSLGEAAKLVVSRPGHEPALITFHPRLSTGPDMGGGLF